VVEGEGRGKGREGGFASTVDFELDLGSAGLDGMGQELPYLRLCP